MRLDSALKKVVPNISRPKKSRHFLMKLSDNFQMSEHSWPCRFHIILICAEKKFSNVCTCRCFEPRKLCTITINIEMILFLFFFFRPLCCLLFDLRIMITAFVSSNSSYLCYECYLFIIDDLL